MANTDPVLPSGTVDDRVFGKLILNARIGWEGQIASPAPDEKIGITVLRLEEPPNAEDQRVFTDFLANYSRLVPTLALALFKLLESTLRTPDWDGPRPLTPEELWTMVRLEGVFLTPGQPLELLFAFRGDLSPDAVFNVAVEGMDVKGSWLDV